MNDKALFANDLFCKGCNCAQSVAAAFSKETGLTHETLLRAAAGFGRGVAGTKGEICGAVSGIMMTLGLLFGPEKALSQDEKDALNAKFSVPVRAFADEFGGLRCGELLSQKAADVPVREFCGVFVRRAVELTEAELEKDTWQPAVKVP